MIRLDKFLANAGIGSRTEVKQAVRKGMVEVNGEIVKNPELKVDETEDVICFQNLQVRFEKNRYYMLYKPAGCVSATSDSREQTVMDLLDIPNKKDLFPVGRLDKDTEGLLLITDDGALAHRLLSPSRHVDKSYYAKIDGRLTKEDVVKFEEGLDIGEKKNTLPARLTILKSGPVSEAEVTVWEGKFHQVKRMFEAVGKKVLYLKRLSMGTLVLDDTLKPGEFRELDREEKLRLKQESHKGETNAEQ